MGLWYRTVLSRHYTSILCAAVNCSFIATNDIRNYISNLEHDFTDLPKLRTQIIALPSTKYV